MLFNSLEFIFVFLPIVFLGYFLLTKFKLELVSKPWLVGSSLFFYSWWNIIYLPLILSSVFINYFVGSMLGKGSNRKWLLVVGILFNVALLGYFKYYDFFISNINGVFRTDLPILHIVLPLGISFFTFQQVAFLVDAYRQEAREYNFVNYSLFITFFPQLIAGPIVHHKEMMPQFENNRNKQINERNIAIGLFIFSIGLCKKVVVADSFAVWANQGFDHTEIIGLIGAWTTSLSYTLQLYFDFSGYTDMAIGIALLFNIKLPINFNSPYKALSIKEFWGRWHITLGRFLSHYIYIPLGGNRKGVTRTYINLFLVFMISGIWHGAGWTFVIWGFLHGIASVIHRLWKNAGLKLHPFIAWFITFQFVNIAWVFFRANSWESAIKVLKGMFGFNGLNGDYVPETLPFFQNIGMELGEYAMLATIIAIGMGLLVTVMSKNSLQMMNSFKPTFLYATAFILLTSLNLIWIIYLTVKSEFLYFNF